jgi:hypothetical protein
MVYVHGDLASWREFDKVGRFFGEQSCAGVICSDHLSFELSLVGSWINIWLSAYWALYIPRRCKVFLHKVTSETMH